jgi:predicted phage terminase large subunit-like protein
VLIEDKGSGTSLIQELEAAEPPLRAIAIVPEKDKVTRMAAQSVKFEAGSVFIPADAPWLDELQRELLQFPYGRHDDQVDSISQYLGWGSYGAADPAGARFEPSKIHLEIARHRAWGLF